MLLNKLEEYAKFLDANEVYYFQSYYGSSHYEITIDDIDEEKIIAKTLLLIDKYDILEKRFLYLDTNKDSLYLVINEEGEIYKERSIS